MLQPHVFVSVPLLLENLHDKVSWWGRSDAKQREGEGPGAEGADARRLQKDCWCARCSPPCPWPASANPQAMRQLSKLAEQEAQLLEAAMHHIR